jgi:hypothetical protein
VIIPVEICEKTVEVFPSPVAMIALFGVRGIFSSL